MKSRVNSLSLIDEFVTVRSRRSKFFDKINKLVNWQPLRQIIESVYTKKSNTTGRPRHDCLVLLRMELVQTWYRASDAAIEEMVNDCISFRHFVGLSLEDDVPDSTTLCRFRNLLVENGLHEKLFVEINRQLEAQGVIVKEGAIMDASITDSPRRPRGRKKHIVVEDRHEDETAAAVEEAYVVETDKANVDKEARWVKKAGRLRFGYKRHTVTDINGLILAEETTAANESDTNHMEVALEKADLPAQTPVYADKGYSSAKNRKMLADRRLKSRIMYKGEKGRPLTQRQKQVNRGISNIRYRVERAFSSIRRWFGGGIARYVGLAKTHAQHIMEALAYNLYRAPRPAMTNRSGAPGALMCLF